MINGKSINDLVQEAYQTAVEKGWHDEKREFGTLIALVHSEITELMEAESEEHAAEELADIVIRIFDMCGLYGYDLESAVNRLIEENYHHMNDKEHRGEKFFGRFGHVHTLAGLHALDMHKDLSKTLELFRKKEQDEKEITLALAKVVRRTLVMGIEFNLNVEKAVGEKMEKNKKRPIKHGGKRF